MVHDSTRKYTSDGVKFAKYCRISLENDLFPSILRNDSLSSETGDFARWIQVELRELYKTHYLVDRFHRSQPMKTTVFPCTGFQKRFFWKDSFWSGAKSSNRFTKTEHVKPNNFHYFPIWFHRMDHKKQAKFQINATSNRCLQYDRLMQRANEKLLRFFLMIGWMMRVHGRTEIVVWHLSSRFSIGRYSIHEREIVLDEQMDSVKDLICSR